MIQKLENLSKKANLVESSDQQKLNTLRISVAKLQEHLEYELSILEDDRELSNEIEDDGGEEALIDWFVEQQEKGKYDG